MKISAVSSFAVLVMLCIGVVTSQGNQDYSCDQALEGQPVDGPCGQRCVCLDGRMQYCCRQRKNFPSMTRSERLRYVRTIFKASTRPRFSPEYNGIIEIHKRLFMDGIHRKEEFLPWHRWYILRFENLLRKVDCQVTLPYWDWSLFPGAAWDTGKDDIWSNKGWGLGGNGTNAGCVQNGRFQQRKWNLTSGDCLRRNFNELPPDIIAVHLTKENTPSTFHDFELELRVDLHNTVHCRIGGIMCGHDSANAPEFFLHHAFIDKIWADWQEKSRAHREAYYSTLPNNLLLKGTQFHPKVYNDTLNLPYPDISNKREENICVVYQDPAHRLYNEIIKRLESLTTAEIQGIPRRSFRPANSAQLKILGVNREERLKGRELLRRLEPKKRLLTKQLRRVLEKMLGFRIDDIPFRRSAAGNIQSRNTSLTYDRWLTKVTDVTAIHTK